MPKNSYQNVFGNYSGVFGGNTGQPASTPTFSGGGAAGASDPSSMSKIMDILGSKGGQTAVAAGGAALSAYGASKDRQAQQQQNAAQLAQSAHQFRANLLNDQLNSDRTLQLNQASQGAQLQPLGQDQSFAQKQALLGTILGQARNVSYTPGDSSVASAMGSHVGGLGLPAGGLDPAMLQRLYGDQATMASIAQHAKEVGQVNPNAPVMDLAPMFGGQSAPVSADIHAANLAEQQRQQQATAAQRALIMKAIDEDITGAKQPAQEKKGSKWGKILKGVGMAASFTPYGKYITPLATAAGSALDGEGAKGALINGGMAALQSGAYKGGGFKNTGSGANIYSAILGGKK